MGKGTIHIYVSEGNEPSIAAFGRAFLEAAGGKQVGVIQFIKDRPVADSEFFKKLEPEMKVFSFENIKNGMNFAKKVLATEECNLLVLADILELVRRENITVAELKGILGVQGETDIILTGQRIDEEISALAEKVYRFVC